ncbi:MAG: SDR family NAD(P)-dependent oxidoreductase, partial [Spirochaetales bacterium]|nr:SDR family NAD(P)-dependent oxidoreductase [Spirochaetales bacterium]
MKDKSVIVTGGGTGIGKALSLLLAKKGASVAIVYSKSKDEAERTVEKIRESGGTAVAIKADVSDEQQVDLMVQKVVQELGKVNYLVNNAGITKQLPFKELDLIDDSLWDELFATNVKGM